MKIKNLIFLILFGTSNAYAQAKPIYFNDKGVTSDPKTATAYGVYGKLSTDELWVLKKYDLYDNVIYTGSFKDELLSQPHGKFTFYNSIAAYNSLNSTNYNNRITDIYVSQKGEFLDGFETGTWFNYFPDGRIMHTSNFKNGKLDGQIRFYTSSGKLVCVGQYKDDLKVGIWYNLEKKQKQIYVNDNLLDVSKLTKLELAAIE